MVTMKNGKVIPMDRSHRLIKRVQVYTSNPEFFFSDSFNAVSLFLDALPHVDVDMLARMIPLLGCSGDERVLWPLFDIVSSGSLEEPVCTSAAIHLGLATSLSQQPIDIVNALIDKLNHVDAVIRGSCALSLGWEGNGSAIEPLMAHFSDPDENVRISVVAALCSIESENAMFFLVEKLKIGTKEEQRLIFLHLWRFRRYIRKVENIYIRYIWQADVDLQLDMLSGLAMLPLSPKIINLYRNFVIDDNARVRQQVLQNLSNATPFEYSALNPHISKLLNDENARVRKAAIRLFTRIR